MKRLLFLVPDLMFATRIEDVAHHLGAQPAQADPGADFDQIVASTAPDLVLLTFDRTGSAWEKMALAAKRAQVPVVAFGSHMNVEAFKRARELGCREVMANSRLALELPTILAKYLGGDAVG